MENHGQLVKAMSEFCSKLSCLITFISKVNVSSDWTEENAEDEDEEDGGIAFDPLERFEQ